MEEEVTYESISTIGSSELMDNRDSLSDAHDRLYDVMEEMIGPTHGCIGRVSYQACEVALRAVSDALAWANQILEEREEGDYPDPDDLEFATQEVVAIPASELFAEKKQEIDYSLQKESKEPWPWE